MWRERQRARSLAFMRPIASPLTVTSPEVGWSMPPMRLSSVVLPLPEGPIRPTKSPASISSESPASTGTAWVSLRYSLWTFVTVTSAIGPPVASAPAVPDAVPFLSMGPSLCGADAHRRPVLQPGGCRENDALAARKAGADLHLFAAREPGLDRS